MNKKNINIVIGANYGDEGKGLVTNWLSNQYDENNSIIILNNGGAQRGHTVENSLGFKHIFHHFGSTANKNYASYCSKFFIINPAIWFMEIKELGYIPKLYIDGSCLVSTPFDMLLNQLIELNRTEKHGSVGVGIWETICRNKHIPLTFDSIKYKTKNFKKMIFNYFQEKIKENEIKEEIKNKLLENVNLDLLYDKFVEDFQSMQTLYRQFSIFDVYNKFDNIIIENGQGLLLDRNVDKIHSTPSNTGIKNLSSLICKNNDNEINTYYVSRTYLTRHGNGPLDNEINKENISKDIKIDETNVYNDYQGNIRYGKLNLNDLMKRIKEDFNQFNLKNNINFVLTHCNELKNEYVDQLNFLKNQNVFNNVYESHDKNEILTYMEA